MRARTGVPSAQLGTEPGASLRCGRCGAVVDHSPFRRFFVCLGACGVILPRDVRPVAPLPADSVPAGQTDLFGASATGSPPFGRPGASSPAVPPTPHEPAKQFPDRREDSERSERSSRRGAL